ncbi:PREDICTED: CKLF-like MARVEL transmembrane domain-containing protein 1 [Hipposideros armiger]|uniref:CKLF-like MARVEL transmembrane domain-containing protein 1 n=1 Tax=Hipposideros armiger TaxID=186990 RepID=A0A8B7SC24_HIPAR|nr:PREDICTED: CKLF-like MARVEL transmembrane domain-containing protein 1 [Hipposideros armiger]
MPALMLMQENCPFCFSVKGNVKMLRLDIINSLVTAIFMIIISVLALTPENTFIVFGGGDLVNSFITAVFLLIVGALTMQEKEGRRLLYVGGSLCLVAAIVCLIDATLVTKTMRNNMKRVLGIENETSTSPAQVEPTPKPAPAEPTLKPAP